RTTRPSPAATYSRGVAEARHHLRPSGTGTGDVGEGRFRIRGSVGDPRSRLDYFFDCKNYERRSTRTPGALQGVPQFLLGSAQGRCGNGAAHRSTAPQGNLLRERVEAFLSQT